MPATGTPLLIFSILTSVTISSSSCIVDATLYQLPPKTNKNLLPCVKSLYTRIGGACSISNLNEGYARTNVTQCVLDDKYIECHCSEKCSKDELGILVASLTDDGSSWEKKCGRSLMEYWKKTILTSEEGKSAATNSTSASSPTGSTMSKFSRTASETIRSELKKWKALKRRRSSTRKIVTPTVLASPHTNQTSRDESKYLRIAREHLLKTTTFKLFWISCMMTFFMVCQLVLITMIRYETMHYVVAPSTLSLTTESSSLEAQRTSSASSTATASTTSTAAVRRARTLRKKPSTTTSIISGEVSAINMPKSGDWYQFKKEVVMY